MQNSFEQLCILASKENWCWNIYCTTCGHLHFKYGFLEITQGQSPDDQDWVTHARTTHYSLPLPKYFTEVQSHAVLSICKDANLDVIARECAFPNWLGYLGLVLHHFGGADQERRLTVSWAAQLLNIVPSNSLSRERLEILSSNLD